MRIYENLFIVRPDATEEEVDHLVDGMSKTVTSAGGTIDKVEKWGKRKLAYRVEKYREGNYVLMQFTAGPDLVREFERRLRVQDDVIKFLSVRIDETLKRIEKRRKEREKRAHRRPQAAAPQPSIAQQIMGIPAEAAHPAPGIPGASQPGSAQPGSAQPGSAQPGSAQPGSAQPGSPQPGSAQSGSAQPVSPQPAAAPAHPAPGAPGVAPKS